MWDGGNESVAKQVMQEAEKKREAKYQQMLASQVCVCGYSALLSYSTLHVKKKKKE